MGRLSPSEIPVVLLETSRITRLLRPCLSQLLAVKARIEQLQAEEGEDDMEEDCLESDQDQERQSRSLQEESPIFKLTRRLEKKNYRRYGKLNNRNAVSAATSSVNETGAAVGLAGSQAESYKVYQFEPAGYRFDASHIFDLTFAKAAELNFSEKVSSAISTCWPILQACFPRAEPIKGSHNGAESSSEVRGAPSLAKLSSAVIGARMEDWIAEVANEASNGLPALKEDRRYINAQEFCYESISIHSRALVFAHHVIALALALPDHWSVLGPRLDLWTYCRRRQLGLLVGFMQQLGAKYQMIAATRGVIPPPSILHPGYIPRVLETMAYADPAADNAITSCLCAHLSTLNPIECFSEAVQRYFYDGLGSGLDLVDRARMMCQVLRCAAQMRQRRQDEFGMWDMLDRWVVKMDDPYAMFEDLSIVAAIFAPLFRQHLSSRGGRNDRLQRVLLSLAITVLSRETGPHILPYLTRLTSKEFAALIPNDRLHFKAIVRIANALEDAGFPFVEARQLQVVLKRVDVDRRDGRHDLRWYMEHRLVKAQRQCLEMGDTDEEVCIEAKAEDEAPEDETDNRDQRVFKSSGEIHYSQGQLNHSTSRAGADGSVDQDDTSSDVSTASSPDFSNSVGTSFILATPSPAMSSHPSVQSILGSKAQQGLIRQRSHELFRAGAPFLRKSVSFADTQQSEPIARPASSQSQLVRRATLAPPTFVYILPGLPQNPHQRSSSEDPLDCLDAETPERPRPLKRQRAQL